MRNPATGPALPRPGNVSCRQRGVAAPARRPLRRARNFADHFTGLGIVLADRVLSDVNEPFAVDRHAVSLGRIEGTDDVTGLVDVDHRRRPHAAIGKRRSQFGLKLDIRQIVRPIEDPNVIVLIHGQPGDASHLPLVRQGFGPVRIELKLWRGPLLCCQVCSQRHAQDQQPEAGRYGEGAIVSHHGYITANENRSVRLVFNPIIVGISS